MSLFDKNLEKKPIHDPDYIDWMDYAGNLFYLDFKEFFTKGPIHLDEKGINEFIEFSKYIKVKVKK